MQPAVIKCFKHDGSSHRMWEYLNFLKEDEHFYYLAAKRAKVIEHDGREWRAPEGALYILSKDRFYNVIVMFLSETKIEYYVNIASPTIVGDNNVFEFIDYDLDLKKDLNNNVKEIDWGEYTHNSNNYKYSSHLMEVLEKTMKETKTLLVKGDYPFCKEDNQKMYEGFISQIDS